MIVRKSQEGISEKRHSAAAQKAIFPYPTARAQAGISMTVTIAHFLPMFAFETNCQLDDRS
ncbi:hypothetical protein GR197_10875 [Rhizobium phaseoli]|uniref:Uncharacterized protein n=1 Tax=Rhizobium phaseoli TaxID=396 RepID=A0A7K3UD03_9HYPH|nr:hypothetical protein [Rhizobium phaseoli]NEJ71039.1 hypothetical protein [Rhizobium phaseoli]